MAKKKDLLYMNWWVKDFLSDTPDLDAEESGAYMLLIGHCFLEGSIPKDKAKLLRISRLYDTGKEDILDGLLERFFIADPKGYINRRAIKERNDALTRMEKASTAGTIGANARWEKERAKKIGLTGDDDILSSFTDHVGPGTGSGIIERLRAEWNSHDNLTPCPRMVGTLRLEPEMMASARSYSEEVMIGAIRNFSALKERAMDAGERVPGTFENFVAKSLDNWTDDAKPKDRLPMTAAEIAASID